MRTEETASETRGESHDGHTRRTYLSMAGAAASGLVGVTTTAAAETRVPVPAGTTVPKSKVRTVAKANRHETRRRRDRATESEPARGTPPEQPGVGGRLRSDAEFDGWAANTESALADGSEFQYMEAEFECPEQPETYDASVVHFFFPAFQNDGSPTTILQPVLAWNWGSNTDWKIAAWWGPTDNGDFIHSPFVDVSPGDRIGGYIGKDKYQSSEPSQWFVDVWNKETNEYTDLTTATLDRGEFRYPYTAFELYNFPKGECQKLPGTCHFSNMYFEGIDGTEKIINWSTWDDDIGCYLNPYASSSSETYIYL